MRAVYLPKAHSVQVIEHPDPTPGPGEAVIRIVAAGICANDLALIEGNNSIGTFPIIPGHECIGVIEAVGPGVPPETVGPGVPPKAVAPSAHLEPGTWVTVYPSVGCGQCCACNEGRINHCPRFRVLGIDQNAGCFAEKMLVRSEQLLPVPASLRHAHGALIEPSAVAVHVNKRGQTKPGSRVVIIGAGVIGLLTAVMARAFGATRIALVDRFEERRAVCTQLGFEEFWCSPDAPEPEVFTQALGSDLDLVYDTVCSKATIQAGLQTLTPGGTVVLVATPKANTTLEIDFPLLYRRELSLVVSRNYVPQDFMDAMAILEQQQINLAPLITACHRLEAFPEAIHALQTRPEQHIKVLIQP